MKGSYILLIELPEPRSIPVGSLGSICFSKGYYAYVGSALNGIEARVGRHLRNNKKTHWHVDYLLQHSTVTKVFIYETAERIECHLSRALSLHFLSVPGFGSSDCNCRSHLYYVGAEGKKFEDQLPGLSRLLCSCPLPPASETRLNVTEPLAMLLH